jgi:hypothetical protein
LRSFILRFSLMLICVACQGDVVTDVKHAPDKPTLPLIPSDLPDLSPSLTLSVSDSSPVTVFASDSLEFSYNVRNVDSVTYACVGCDEFARTKRTGPNKVLLYVDVSLPVSVAGELCFNAFVTGVVRISKCSKIHTEVKPGGLLGLPDSIRASELVTPYRLQIATYEGSGEAVHPDILRFKGLWNGWECVLSFTPYANSNALVENPSLAVSHDCQNWIPAPGVAAPLVKNEGGYNSDSEMFLGDDGCLHVVYRVVTDSNTIKWTRSCNGPSDWSKPKTLFAAPNHSAVSPTIAVGPDGVRRIWYVDASFSGCNSLVNVVRMRVMVNDSTVGPEQTTDLTQNGYQIWHAKVGYVPERKQFWAIYAAYQGSCGQNDLFLAISTDSTGTKWKTFALPVMSRLDTRFKFSTLYRPAFLYDPVHDALSIWPSALESDRWGIFSGNWDRIRLFRSLYASNVAPASALIASVSLQRKLDLPVTPRLSQLMREDRQ